MRVIVPNKYLDSRACKKQHEETWAGKSKPSTSRGREVIIMEKSSHVMLIRKLESVFDGFWRL